MRAELHGEETDDVVNLWEGGDDGVEGFAGLGVGCGADEEAARLNAEHDGDAGEDDADADGGDGILGLVAGGL